MPDTPISPLPDNDADEPFLTREEAIAELQALWAEGIASGPGRFKDLEELKQEFERRLRERGK
ncbi:MAG TPA: hypothetical protein VE650_00120 [Acetobacteraceae bacterium]|jgi:hypothetical protein|nr:hypothetical protein [Acetobacteraceae bacterium]